MGEAVQQLGCHQHSHSVFQVEFDLSRLQKEILLEQPQQSGYPSQVVVSARRDQEKRLGLAQPLLHSAAVSEAKDRFV